jgi:molecular chaperone DnaK (HSP70)
MMWLLRQGTVIPCKYTKPLTTVVDNQTVAEIIVKQGESEVASKNTTLYAVKLDIEPRPAGIPRIQVEFKMDESQILRSKAYDEISPENTIEIPVKLPGRIDERTIIRLQMGYITTDVQHSPEEQSLNDLTTLCT